MEKIKKIIDQLVEYILSKNKGKKTETSVFQVFDDIQVESVDSLNGEHVEKKPLKDQLKEIKQPDKKTINYLGYIFSNFKNPLYFFLSKNYKTGKNLKGAIRGGNKVEAGINAKKIYNLEYIPEKINQVEVENDRLIEKIQSNPTFFLKKQVSKGELGEFLIEYSSLMEDGLEKKQAIDILTSGELKDKGLLEFMSFLKTSSSKMSALMKEIQIFDDYTISIVESSEQSGGDSDLYKGLSSLGLSYVNEAAARSKFLKGLIYPGVLTLVAIALFFGAVFGLVPILANLFGELVGKDKLPGILLYLLSFSENVLPLVIKSGFIIGGVILVKKILLTNSIILGLRETLKLKLPLIGLIIQLTEENKLFRILSQTINSNLTEVDKIHSLEKATSNILYKGFYRTMGQLYPSRRNFLTTLQDANQKFGGKLFGQRAMHILNLAKGDTDKVLKKYLVFLEKNLIKLDLKMGTLNGLIGGLALMVIALMVVGVLALVFGMVLSMISSM